MALLEAQAAGCPVVAARRPGVAAIVADGVSGLLVPEGDDAAFARAVARLLDDSGTRAAMARAALERTASVHGMAAAARVLDDVLRQAAR